MRPVPLILVCGHSLFLLAIEAALARVPGLVVVRYPSWSPLTVERLEALRPAVVVTEWEGNNTPTLLLALIHHAIPLLMVDATHQRGHLLRSAQVDLVGMSDITGLLATLNDINQI